jgi:heavy metal sensor kinase
MIESLSPRSVRVRLALWYVAALAAVLATYAAVVFLFVRHSFRETLDSAVYADADRALDAVSAWTGGGHLWRPDAARLDAENEDLWMLVLGPDGAPRFQSPAAARLPLADDPARAATVADGGIVSAAAATAGGGRLRLLSGTVHVANAPFTILVARSEAATEHDLRVLLVVLIAGVPVGVGAAGLGGYVLARRALAPVDRMSEMARAITAARLTDRLPVENPHDELGRLAAAFNDLLARLQAAFERMRQFTADASHELRTPLTAMRSVGEDGLRERRSDAGYRDVIGSMLEDVDRLTTLVDALLTLSRADAGDGLAPLEPVDLAEIAHDVAAQLAVLAEENRQTILVEGAAPAVRGHRVALRQALVNLVDNAVKHGPSDRPILVRLSRAPGSAVIDVVDQGAGIPAEHRAKIFERFYRVDPARSRERGGAGLGLAVARWAVELHGGRLEYRDVPGGSVFRMTLPSPSV